MFVVQIPGLEDCRHGELLNIVASALQAHGKKYEKIRVSFVDTAELKGH